MMNADTQKAINVMARTLVDISPRASTARPSGAKEAAAEQQQKADIENCAADREDRDAAAPAEGGQHHRQHAP